MSKSENKKKGQLSVRVTEEDRKNLDVYCERYHKKQSDVIRFAIQLLLNTALDGDTKKKPKKQNKKKRKD